MLLLSEYSPNTVQNVRKLWIQEHSSRPSSATHLQEQQPW